MIHSPTAILREGKICLKYWETEYKYVPFDSLSSNFGKRTFEEHEEFYKTLHTDWLNSAKIVPFQGEVYDNLEYIDYDKFVTDAVTGIPLDSIADRISIVDGVAVITTPTDPHADLIDLVVKSFGKSRCEVIEIIKEQFKIERR